MTGSVRATRILLLLAACSGVIAPSFCSASFDIVAEYNDASPDGNGHLATFTQPALSNSGEVAFLSLLLGTQSDDLDNIALYRGNAAGLTVIARRGVTTLDGQLLSNFINNSPAINGTSVSHMADRSTAPGQYVALRGTGGAIDSFLLAGSSSPSGNNQLSTYSIPVYNAGGTAAYRAFYSGTNLETAIYTRGSNGSVTLLLEEFQTLPHDVGDPTITVLSLDTSLPTINASGQVAITATVDDGIFSRKSVILLDGSTPTEVAHDASMLADGVTSLDNIFSTSVPINDSGQIAFTGSYTQPASTARRGVFITSASSTTLITPTLLPGSAVVPSNLRIVNMNNAAEVAFTADFGTGSDPTGAIYIADAQGTDLIALEDTATPAGSTYFRRLVPESIALNAGGQLAFMSELSNSANGSLAGRALFRYDPTGGLAQIIRTGDAFAGSTIVGLGFTGDAYSMTQNNDVTQSLESDFSGFNNSGQLAFNYSLANGLSGIAIWSPTATAVPGDYNGNGIVDAADYTLWRDHLGQTFSLPNENPAAGTPGTVDQEDYDFWKSRFGATSGSGSISLSPSAAVPEPSSCLLLTVIGLFLWAVRRR